MVALRFSSIRAGYTRGGLTFARPEASPLADGRLALLLSEDEVGALGEAKLRQLLADPAITIDGVDADGAVILADPRKAAKPNPKPTPKRAPRPKKEPS